MNASTIAERALNDIQAAERQMRRQAEDSLREYVRLLTALARHFAGDALEELRRNDPAAAQGWGPAQWNEFFTRSVLQTGQPYLLQVKTWGGEPPAGVQEALQQLQERVSQLDRQAEQARQENRRLQQRLKETEALLARAQATMKKPPGATQESQGPPPVEAVPQTSRMNETARVIPLKRPPAASGRPFGHPAILEALSGWSAPRRPGRATQLAEISDQRWLLQSMALYLVACWGISPRPEIDALLGAASGADKRTTALRGAVDGLVELGLLERIKLSLTAPLSGGEAFTTSLIVMRLTEQGQLLCRELGWEIVPGDYQRLAQLSEAQQLGSLAFAAQARLRGYQVQVQPAPVNGFQADALVEKEPERSYVVVGTEDGDLLARWQSAGTALQLGFCAVDNVQRTRLAEQIRANQPNGHGAAADLYTLLHQKEVTPDKPLWLEIW